MTFVMHEDSLIIFEPARFEERHLTVGARPTRDEEPSKKRPGDSDRARDDWRLRLPTGVSFDSSSGRAHESHEVTSNDLKARVASGKRVARYDRVHCRALAIYAMADSVADVVPYYGELGAAGRAQADSLLAFVRVVIADSRNRIERLPSFRVVEIHDSNHYVFLQHPREVARAMRMFLSSADSL
jgi:pimeloyl-ACP methyl ester carboxylesterase